MTTNVIHTGFLTAIIFIDDILKLDYNTIGKSFTSLCVYFGSPRI